MMVYFKLMLRCHREPSEVKLVEILSKSLYKWVELGVPSYTESATALSDCAVCCVIQKDVIGEVSRL